jgi:hypothetical protein
LANRSRKEKYLTRPLCADKQKRNLQTNSKHSNLEKRQFCPGPARYPTTYFQPDSQLTRDMKPVIILGLVAALASAIPLPSGNGSVLDIEIRAAPPSGKGTSNKPPTSPGSSQPQRPSSPSKPSNGQPPSGKPSASKPSSGRPLSP